MLSEIAAAAVVAAGGSHTSPSHHHVRGCNSDRCDRRIARFLERWREKHAPPMRTALASWYDDSGTTASNLHAALGFAHLGPGEGSYAGMAMGTRVRFCAASCATGTMDDHGPYVAGREFDLGPALKSAIGCSDLCRVRWRIVR